MTQASSSQINYIQDLLETRDISPEGLTYARAAIAAGLDRARASRWITELKGRPIKQDQSNIVKYPIVRYRDIDDRSIGYVLMPDGQTVPRGSYAVDTTGMDNYANDTTFYRLWIGDEDDQKWSGKMSMSLLHGPEQTTISPVARHVALKLIAQQGPEACATRYGLAIGKCGICGRRLTNDVSRERGIGPICAENWGW